MKSISRVPAVLLTICFLFAFIILQGQDTIHLKNKIIEIGKVIEINPQVIKYTRTDMSGGPVFIKNTSEIELIRFENGEIQYFPAFNTGKTPSKTTEFQEIKMVNTTLFYDKKPLSDGKLKKLILAYPDEGKKKPLLNEFDLMKKNKRKQHIWGTAGPIVAGAFALALIAGYADSGKDAFIVVGLAGGGIILLGSLTKSKEYNRARVVHLGKIAELYNLP